MDTAPRRSPLLALGAVLMAFSLVVGLVLVGSLVSRFSHVITNTFLATPLTAPVDTSVYLTQGEWAIYVADGGVPVGANVQAALVTRSNAAAAAALLTGLTTFDVAVTGPDGRQVVLHDATSGSNQQITRGSNSFTAQLKFMAPSAGSYRVVIAGNDGTAFIFAPTFAGIVSMFPGGRIAGVLGCGLLFVFGLLLLIIGAVRGRRPAVATAAPQALQWPVDPIAPASQGPVQLPPAGWYPDPTRSATWRYWDGQVWTAHTG